MFWSACVSFGNYFSNREIQVFQREPGKDSLLSPARINKFSPRCKAERAVAASSEAGTGLNSSGLCWFDLRGEEMLRTVASQVR